MGRIVNPQDLQAHVSKLISAKKQIGNLAIDLTVKNISKLRSEGSIDFGGSEYQEPRTVTIPASKINPDDNYGWWDLLEGDYFLQFNEKISLEENHIGWLQPHPRFLKTGCYHPGCIVKELGEDFVLPFYVPKVGVRIKENARISQLIVLEL